MRSSREKLYHTRIERAKWTSLSLGGVNSERIAPQRNFTRGTSRLSVLVIVRRKYDISSNDFTVTPLPRLCHYDRTTPSSTESGAWDQLWLWGDSRTPENCLGNGLWPTGRKSNVLQMLIHRKTIMSRLSVRSNSNRTTSVSYSSLDSFIRR